MVKSTQTNAAKDLLVPSVAEKTVVRRARVDEGASIAKHKALALPDALDEFTELTHDGNNASIIIDEKASSETPWTPRSLVRAKSAIIYKQTLNDTLLILERNMFFFSEWKPYFVSLQEDFMLLFQSREKWEQGIKPDKIIELFPSMMLSDMKVDVVGPDASFDDDDGSTTIRLFRRRLLETDEIDYLRQSLVVDSGSVVDSALVNNPEASAHSVIEFGSHSQSTFELWTKTIRRILQVKREQYVADARGQSRLPDYESQNNNAEPSPGRPVQATKRAWVSPGHDSKLTLHQSEIWCNRVLSGEKEKAESELRRIVAMEKLVYQVTSPRMALLVYEKVSRVHELFIANSRREIERIDNRERPISAEVLNFFADHLKRKYSVFLILALAYGVGEEEIRQAHELMCEENGARNAGVGGGVGETHRTSSCYGFEDDESLELYDKYRDAAINYHKMNYGDPAAAEEEDAIMHLPVMLQVAVVRQDEEEAHAMLDILDTVKDRLVQHCSEEENNSA
ncbi:hypothetical protein Poli38472_008493 [Pythium oligandrum]|uniref:Uncharacterized protein n=1 Tax=Pythium oligandrum TaxID=41045 RepID=A0A8K1FA33_PYTOL|nr:hypothetical protein Poli38472_008493 [Pythium oligandrum]|eukprot:TMW55845.1 hypothetical protein Poli38472_008493 [Pythium oligandrum]